MALGEELETRKKELEKNPDSEPTMDKHPAAYNRNSIKFGGKEMKYGIAWLLGVPVSILVIWFVLSHIL